MSIIVNIKFMGLIFYERNTLIYVCKNLEKLILMVFFNLIICLEVRKMKISDHIITSRRSIQMKVN